MRESLLRQASLRSSHNENLFLGGGIKDNSNIKKRSGKRYN